MTRNQKIILHLHPKLNYKFSIVLASKRIVSYSAKILIEFD